MISRIWHGWTSHEKADAYESLLREEVFTGIMNRLLPGFIDIQMLRRPFIMRWNLLRSCASRAEAVKEFAGEDYEACVVLPKARELLSRFDERSQHYEIRIVENEAEA